MSFDFQKYQFKTTWVCVSESRNENYLVLRKEIHEILYNLVNFKKKLNKYYFKSLEICNDFYVFFAFRYPKGICVLM